jgi:nuclear pore complex protein Nup107
MHLTAARLLASRVSSSDIAKSKTPAILGVSVDFANLESEGVDEDLTEVLDGSAEQKRLLRKHLLAEAKTFRELETLIESLDNMETVTSMGDLLHEYVQKPPKQSLTNLSTQTIFAEMAEGLEATTGQNHSTD